MGMMRKISYFTFGCAIAFSLELLFRAALAQSGDTHIHVEYRSTAYRVRPNPKYISALAKRDIVLHADGTVEDAFTDTGPRARPTDTSKRKLGDDNSTVKFSVIDSQTISRTSDNGIMRTVLTVRTSGKSCEAKMDYFVNPTIKEVEGFSSELGVKGYYRDRKFVSATCKIY